MNIAIRDISLSTSAPQVARRERFDPAQLWELTRSIEQYGVLQPIIVRAISNGANKVGGDELVAGERRYVAAQRAGLEEIPAVVHDLSDYGVLEVQLIENLQREDAHPLDEALGYDALIRQHGHTAEELADRVGRSVSYVYQRLKLTELTPKARKAFSQDKITTSVALLLARIPASLQDQALEAVSGGKWNDPMTTARARDYIEREYMLRLDKAPFKTSDANLVPWAGACAACPKRTGNQQLLFADIERGDICTDPKCFASKVRAAGDEKVEAWRAKGKTAITGKEAKQLVPNGFSSYARSYGSYVQLSEKEYYDGKYRTAGAIAGKGAERFLLQDPASGSVLEVIKKSDVDKALRAAGKSTVRDDGTAARRKKQKIESAFRHALYEQLRGGLEPPTMHTIARRMCARLLHETLRQLAKLRGFTPPKAQYGGPDYGAINHQIDAMSDDEVALFVNDMIYVNELEVGTWSESKPEALLAEAERQGVDVAAIRASVTPAKKKPAAKKKAVKKAPAKKAAKKRATKEAV